MCFKTTEDSVRKFFSKAGDITGVEIATDDGRSRGFCYVEFSSPSMAQEALKLDRQDLDGRPVLLYFATRMKKPGFGGKGGNPSPTNNLSQATTSTET